MNLDIFIWKIVDNNHSIYNKLLVSTLGLGQRIFFILHNIILILYSFFSKSVGTIQFRTAGPLKSLSSFSQWPDSNPGTVGSEAQTLPLFSMALKY